MEKQRIAVVGSGIAGLAAAWLLRQRHEVTLFERNRYFGGHTHTHWIEDPAGRRLAVDSGFIVFNERNYPNLTALFRELGVASRASDMSFAVSLDQGNLEYAGSSLNSLYAQRRNLLSPRHQRMVWDILRFNRRCKQDLERDGFAGQTLDEYLTANGLSAAFRDRYLLPMAAAIWSCPTATMGRFPAESLATFFRNHGLLDLTNRPQWRTVVDGSHTYVQRMLEALGPGAYLGCEVTRILRSEDRVSLRLADGTEDDFDQVVLASHADQSLALLGDPTENEKALLSRFGYQTNRALLHSDERLMPKDRRVWSSWNYLARSGARKSADGSVSVTYWMNLLQELPSKIPYLVSLNPLTEPSAERVHAEISYDHPVFDGDAMAAQPRLVELQGVRRTWFCGSYFGYGFHEDALRSALDVARALGVAPAWDTASTVGTSHAASRLDTPGLVVQPQEA